MQTHPTHPIDESVDPDELDRHITAMYRDVANEVDRELHFPIGRALAEALGYPAELLDRLPSEAVASFAGVGPFSEREAQPESFAFTSSSFAMSPGLSGS